MFNSAYNGYNQNMLIDEHFAIIQNQIDIATKEEIRRLSVSGIQSENAIREVNELRKKQLKEVELAKRFNFDHKKHTEEAFYVKWKLLIENGSIAYTEKLDMIKSDIIVQDCVVLNNPLCKSKTTLLLFDWYVNIKGLTLLR